MSFSALPDGRIAIAHLPEPVDTVTATQYATWLNEAARNSESTTAREQMTQSSAELLSVIRKAQGLRWARAH